GGTRRDPRRRGDGARPGGPAGFPASHARRCQPQGQGSSRLPALTPKGILSQLVKRTNTVLQTVFGVRGRGRDLFSAAQRLDLEGVVAKGVADPYTPATVWWKIRNGF